MATIRSSDSVTTRSSSQASDQSIMNRKIERRGIPGSFSANLGRRTSSPRETDNRDATAHRTNGGSTSVKAIVAWIESSSAKEEVKTPTSVSSDTQSKTASTLSKSSAAAVPVTPRQCLPMAPDVEEYSLTLLKYREYYTESPLARCLDKKIEKDVFSVKPLDGNTSPDTSPSKNVSGIQTPEGNEISSIEHRLSTGSSASRKNSSNHQEAAPRSGRDLEEVNEFWATVRSYLRISNEELEETEDTEQISRGLPSTPSKDATDVSLYSQDNENSHVSTESSPHRKANSEPNTAVVRRRGRKRFLSVEAKMLEIDDFLGTA
jgi:hypothetical protein